MSLRRWIAGSGLSVSICLGIACDAGTDTTPGGGGAGAAGAPAAGGTSSDSGITSTTESMTGGGGDATVATTTSTGMGCVPQGDETCASPNDEDCDGTECAIWAHSYGDATGNQVPTWVATTSTGDVYLIGTLNGSVVFAGETVTGDADHQAFLAKLSSSGQELWIHLLPKLSSFRMVVTEDDGLVLVGRAGQPVDFGGGDLALDYADTAFAAFDLDGNYLWSTSLTVDGDALARVSGIGRAPTGEIVCFGDAAPGSSYEGQPITALGPEPSHLFSLALDPNDGALLWSQDFPIATSATTVFTDPAFNLLGEIVVAGFYDGAINLGGPTLPFSNSGAEEAFFARFDSAGNHLQSSRFCIGCRARDVAVGAQDEVYVSLAAPQLSTLDGESTGPQKGFLVRLTPDAHVEWLRPFFSPAVNFSIPVPQIDVESNGDITFVVAFRQALDMEFGTLTAVGDFDLAVGKIHPDGSPRWFRSFGEPGLGITGDGRRMDVLPSGEPTVAFMFVGGGIDLGTGFLAGNNDMVVARLAP